MAPAAAVAPAATMPPTASRGGGGRKGGRAEGDGCTESKHSFAEHDDFSKDWTFASAPSCRLVEAAGPMVQCDGLLQIRGRRGGLEGIGRRAFIFVHRRVRYSASALFAAPPRPTRERGPCGLST